MTEFTIGIAGRVIGVRALFDSTREFCREYLCGGEPDFEVCIVGDDIAFERDKSAREDALEGIPPRQFSDAYLETIAVQRKIAEGLFDYGTLLFHGSVVAVDGAGYLFTAKSGTGKSTHTRLWREVFGDRAVMVNDDKPFLIVGENSVLACGAPWSGKHGLDANVTLPLAGICILERGPENIIRPLPAASALPRLLHETYCPQGREEKFHSLVERLLENTPLWRMECTKDPEAARVAHGAMSASL